MRRLILALAILVPAVALADDPPCKPDGDGVKCSRAGFDVLVKRLIDTDAKAKEVAIRLAASEHSVAEVKAALDACLARPIPKPPPPPSAFSRVLPVALGIVGAATLTASVAGDWGAGGRTTGAVVGLALVGTGIVLALP